MRDTRIVAHAMPVKPSFIHFDKVPRGAVTVTRKLLDGNLVAAVRSARDAGFGIAASYCDERGIRRRGVLVPKARQNRRSEEHTSELQSLMRISYAVFCLKKK